MASNNKFELSDKEFQEAMEALPSYNYDLALEIEHLTSLSQVPENKMNEFISFYEEYKNPEIKKDKFPIKQIAIYSIVGILFFFYFEIPNKYLSIIYSTTKVLVLHYWFSKFWLKLFKRNSNNLIGVLNNYFLSWALSIEYKGKTTRVEFWQSFLPHFLISNLLLFFAGYTLLSQEPHGIFEINSNLKLITSYYDLSYFFVSIPLIIRRLRDIGKKNKILWYILCSIPIYGLLILSKPSFKPEKK